MKTDGRIKAAKNELMVLAAIAKFGWLKTRQIAKVGWPASTADGGYRMAQRTVKRLKEKHCILSKIAPDGATIHAIALAGARKLAQEGIEAGSHKDAMRAIATYAHRSKANDIAIQHYLKGYWSWSEHEIQKGVAPIKTLRGKVPDVLLDYSHKAPAISAEPEEVLAWVEVENCYKENRELNKLLDFFCAILGALDGRGMPRKFREPIAPGISIGFGIITVETKKERDRLLTKLAEKRATEPYEFAWETIGKCLLIRDTITQSEVAISVFI
jgi:hypothetical protein